MSTSTVDMTKGVYRRLYSGFIRGKRINRVSIGAEAWFWRLHALADDFGNLEADPNSLHVDMAPRRRVTRAQCTRWVNELVKEKLIRLYEVDGEHFIHIRDFLKYQPAGRNGKRIKKCDAPGESGGIRVHPEKSGCVVRPETEDEKHSHKHTETEKQTDAVDSPDSNPDDISCSSSLSRPRAQILFHDAIEPLFGRDGGTRHPTTSPQWQADQTCARRWFDDMFPEGVPVDRGKFDRIETLCKQARQKNRPMAWLTDKIKRMGDAA